MKFINFLEIRDSSIKNKQKFLGLDKSWTLIGYLIYICWEEGKNTKHKVYSDLFFITKYINADKFNPVGLRDKNLKKFWSRFSKWAAVHFVDLSDNKFYHSLLLINDKVFKNY